MTPTWNAAMLNQGQTTGMGKLFSGTIDINVQYATLRLNDANCTTSSTCTITWIGLSVGPNYGDLVNSVEAKKWAMVVSFCKLYWLYIY